MENHADAAADDDRLDVARINVVAEKFDFAFHARLGIQFVHPVERAEKSGFAAAARPDDGGDGARGDVERDVFDRLVRAEKDGKIADGQRGVGIVLVGGHEIKLCVENGRASKSARRC